MDTQLTMTKFANLCLFALLLAGTQPATAQTIGYAEAIDRLAVACRADIQKYCKGIQLGNGRVRECLNRNQAQVSSRCKSGYVEAFDLLEKRAAAQAAVLKICDADIRRLCAGVEPGDGNLLECGLKAQRSVSPRCNQAITDAGWR